MNRINAFISLAGAGIYEQRFESLACSVNWNKKTDQKKKARRKAQRIARRENR